MPHIIFEHSFFIEDKKINSLLLNINQTIAKNDGNFDINQCKARAVLCSNFVLADGLLNQNFIHITVKIIEGRTLEVRNNLAQNLLELVNNFFENDNLSNVPIALSVDIAEMAKEIYQKKIIN